VNKKRLLYFTVLAFLILGLIVTPILPGVFGDFIPLQIAWKKQPVVCIDNEIPEGMNDIYTKRMFLKGITPWENKLNNRTNSENFDIRIIFGFIKDCNVMVFYEDIIKDSKGRSTNVLANVTCSDSIAFGHNCIIKFDNSQNMFHTSKEMSNIMKHEMGHVLGLGHRQPLGDENIMAALASIAIENDIMFPQSGPFQKITDVDLDALLFMYSSDGWKGDNIDHFNYIIHRYDKR